MTTAHVSINLTAEDLFKLLGIPENGEVPLAISQKVINDFTARHLKPLINDQALGEMEQRLQAAIKETADNVIGKTRKGWQGGIDISPDIREELQRLVLIECDNYIRAEIANQMARLTPAIEKRVNDTLERFMRGQDSPSMRRLIALGDAFGNLEKQLKETEKLLSRDQLTNE